MPVTTWSITPRPSRPDELPIRDASMIRSVSNVLAQRNTRGARALPGFRVNLSTYSTPDSLTDRTTEFGRSVSRPVPCATAIGENTPGSSRAARGSGAKRSAPTRSTKSSSAGVRATGSTPMNASARS